MIKKSFVSLSFSSKKLQILQLSSSKKKVAKYITIDLPEGLINNRGVQDKEALAVILKKLWKKLGLKEKSVGIVVPEFSTFIKNLNLPKLEAQELDEAVRWQAQEFLPTTAKDMSMDWRITKRLRNNYQILAVAMEKRMLNSYVDAVDLAGLFPLVVETPSLSLARVSSSNQAGRLIVYHYYDEVILIVTDGERIFGSSVVAAEENSEVLRTAVNIINHYKETKINKVLVGGINFDQELLNNLQSTLKVPINRLSVKIAGLTSEDIQKYLIPIALQFKKPTDPSDEDTINLLPKTMVKKYAQKKLKVQTWSLMMFVTFMIWSSFFAAVGTYIFNSQQINSLRLENGFQLNTVSETTDARAKIKGINQIADKVLAISKASVLPQTLLNGVYEAKSQGIIISRYKLDLDTGLIDIKGTAATRGNLISFKQALEENKDLAQIAIPISSFEVESNLGFEMSFIYLPIIKLR